MPVVEREPKTDHVTVAFIGGGFAGLRHRRPARRRPASTTSASSRRAATSAARGTGTATRARSATRRASSTCRCSKRPATCRPRSTPTAAEILEHSQRIGKQFGLYDNALFHTEVTDLEWDDDRYALDHPHQPRRRVHRPVPGHGHRTAARAEAARASPASRTSGGTRSTPAAGTTSTPAVIRSARRWTAWPTSGSAIIGTGATAVQCVPHLAKACRELYVFQRTPSSVDVRDNRPTDPDVVRRRSPRPAGSSAGWRTSPPTRPAW